MSNSLQFKINRHSKTKSRKHPQALPAFPKYEENSVLFCNDYFLAGKDFPVSKDIEDVSACFQGRNIDFLASQ